MILLPDLRVSRLRALVLLAAAVLCPLAIPSSASGSASAAGSSVTRAARKHRIVRRHRVGVAPLATSAATRSSRRSIVRNGTRAAVIHTNTGSILRASTARRRIRGRRFFFNPWTEPTYADSTVGDIVDGEDLAVRKAAVDAIGPYNGTVIVADPQDGRILTMVNQNLALKGAYQPCSTVKVMVSLASLKEQIVDPTSQFRLSKRRSMDMTKALAMSNNLYFAHLGQELGFERVQKYGQFFGLGEKAGLDIPGEEAGYLANEAPETGVGMMTSFGDGIRLTPLELTSMVSAVANGGTMYYLQYPKSQEEAQKVVPRIKRQLDIADLIPPVKAGMMGAVEYGTARRASYSNLEETIVGKTGTCTDTARPGVHLGWFGSFNDVGTRKLVVVVLLTGGRGVSGPIASGIAGDVYHNLSLQNYFGPGQAAAASIVPPALLPLRNSFVQ